MSEHKTFKFIDSQINPESEANKKKKKNDDGKIYCPVCGQEPVYERCKVICKSKMCIYLVIYNCSE